MYLRSNRTVAVLGVILLAAGIVVAQRTSPSDDSHHMHMHAQQASMMKSCQEGMAQHQEFSGAQADMNAKIDALAKDMNRAEGEQKIEAMAALLSALVEQRSVMMNGMVEMMPKMMHHMSEHLSDHGDMGSAMTGCPMMQMMSDSSSDLGGHDHGGNQ